MVLSRIRFIYPLSNTLEEANNLMAKFRISGVPITEGGKLVGIITNRDLKFEEDFSKKIKESMTSENLITAKEGITLEEAKKILAKARKEKLPIVDDNFNLKGLITIKDIEKQIKYPLSAKDSTGPSAVRCGDWYHSKRSGSCTGAGKCTCRCRLFWILHTDILQTF